MGVREFLTTFAAGTELRYENDNENEGRNASLRKTKNEKRKRELKR